MANHKKRMSDSNKLTKAERERDEKEARAIRDRLRQMCDLGECSGVDFGMAADRTQDEGCNQDAVVVLVGDLAGAEHDGIALCERHYKRFQRNDGF